MSQNPNVLYISDEGPENSAFPSQVLGMLQAWTKVCNAKLLFRSRGNEEIQSANPSKRLPNIGRLLWQWEAKRNHWAQQLESFDIIHCRGPIATYMAIKSMRNNKKKKQILFDCRGIIVEELDLISRGFLKRLILPIRKIEYRAVEKYAARNADVVLAVSEKMSEYLEVQYGRRADIVNPCIVEKGRFIFSQDNRRVFRHSLGIPDNTVVFIYIGGAQKWQRLDMLGEWYRKSMPQNARLIIGTHDVEQLQVESGIDLQDKRVIIRKAVNHLEIPSYLSAADFGVIFRDDSIVNRVASPIKLSEYLASGLKVITNQISYQMFDSDSVMIISPDQDRYTDYALSSIEERIQRSYRNSDCFSAEHVVNQLREQITGALASEMS